MARYIAFLRAINVGGHTVKMDYLRALFESLGFTKVETFIASGNVIFESNAKHTQTLENQIEKKLNAALGFPVATFIRTDRELTDLVVYPAFSSTKLASAVALNVALLKEPLDASAQLKLLELQTDLDDFHTHGREMYWLCRKKQSESTFSNAVFEKKVGCAATLRGMSTLEKMAAKYGVSKPG